MVALFNLAYILVLDVTLGLLAIGLLVGAVGGAGVRWYAARSRTSAGFRPRSARTQAFALQILGALPKLRVARAEERAFARWGAWLGQHEGGLRRHPACICRTGRLHGRLAGARDRAGAARRGRGSQREPLRGRVRRLHHRICDDRGGRPRPRPACSLRRVSPSSSGSVPGRSSKARPRCGRAAPTPASFAARSSSRTSPSATAAKGHPCSTTSRWRRSPASSSPSSARRERGSQRSFASCSGSSARRRERSPTTARA